MVYNLLIYSPAVKNRVLLHTLWFLLSRLTCMPLYCVSALMPCAITPYAHSLTPYDLCFTSSISLFLPLASPWPWSYPVSLLHFLRWWTCVWPASLLQMRSWLPPLGVVGA